VTSYIADQTWPEEAGRLQQLEGALDEQTRRQLARLGLRAGMRCLEVGAGSGSIACWLAREVGPSGSVVATDLDTTLLQPLQDELPNLRVVRENIAEGVGQACGAQPFDLVHARLVLGHLAQPERALAHLLRALRPGGVALIEDADFLWTDVGEQPLFPESAAQAYFPVWCAAVAYMREHGYAVHWGRRLATELRRVGFERVAGEAVALVGNKALQAAMRLTLARFAPALVEQGSVSQRAVDACLTVLADQDVTFTGSPVFSIWGFRPG
jgi:ubiquinone/menaquinone biosynthesis C-methylase UbiE